MPSTNKMQLLFLAAFAAGMAGLIAGGVLASTAISVGVPLVALLVYVLVGSGVEGGRVPRQQFGDSAYYLGFLFTLGALMVSMFALGMNGEAAVAPLLGRFAAALTTTMAGLVARMWIVNLSGASEGAVENAEKALVQQSERFRQELENVTSGLIAQGYRVQESVATVTEDMASRTRETMEQASSTMTESVVQASSTLARRAEEAFSSGEEALRKGFSRLDKTFARLEQTLADQVDQLQESFQGLVRRLTSTDLPDDLLVRRLRPALDQLDTAVRGLADSTGQIGATMGSVEAEAGRIEGHVVAVGGAVESLRGACEGAAEQLDQVRHLGTALESVQQRIDGLGRGLHGLSEQLGDYTQQQGRLSHAHETQVEALREHVHEMKSALSEADGMVTQVGRELVAAASFVRQQLERS
jgi:cob(I)alamin adenosyltransferase